MARILIVDDHPLYREGMVSALRAHLADVDIHGEGSAEDGLRYLERQPEIDLVLIDLRLPGMDGFGALTLYAQRFPAVARAVVSAAEDEALMRRAYDAGAVAYIPKSMTVTEVAAAIQIVLAGGMFVPDAGRQKATRDTVPSLTLRQVETLRLLGEGRTNKEIAAALEITERTARAHVAAILVALRAENRTQAVIAAQRLGYLPATDTVSG